MKKTICTRTISLVCIFALLVSLMVPSVSATSNSYFPAYTGNSGSLVDGLNTIGVDSSFSFRKEIAKANGIDNYQGTADQNTALLQKLCNGVLIDPNATGTTFTGDVGGIKNGVTVTKDNAPLRATANGDDEILYRAEKGAVLELLGTKRTGFMGIKKWYKVSYKGGTYYLYGENAEVHSHNYTSYIVAGTHFKVCKAWLASRRNVALGSDAFFPFSDNIKRAFASGVKYIAEPGGSIRDDLVIEECNKKGMVMAFTGMRLFHH